MQKETSPDINYFVEDSKEGLPTLSVTDDAGRKIYLHSKYNPLKDSQTLEEKFNPEKYDTIIILGTALGYHLAPLKKIQNKYKTIILIDAIKNLKDEIAKIPETDFLAKPDNILFLTGLSFSEIEAALDRTIDFSKINGVDVIDHPASIRAFGEYYSGIKKIIQAIINKKAGDLATRKAFGILYLRNILKNFYLFPSLYPVSAFFNAMRNYPALVIASGPGIERLLKVIKDNQNKFFIITVESALRTLIKNGIAPDFFVSIDPQAFIYEHVFDLDTGKAVPIFTLSSHSLMIERYKGNQSLLSLNTHPVSQIIEDMFPGKTGSVDSLTGTVAGDAILSAEKFGFNAIGLAGFDFSFPDFKIYPRGTAYQNRFANFSNRLNTIENINFNYVMKSSKGVKFDNKFTRKSFIQYKEAVERLLGSLDIKNIFNINSAGIPAGIQHSGIERFTADYCKTDISKQEIIRSIFGLSQTTSEIIFYKNINELVKDSDVFNDIINASLDDKPQKKINRLKSLTALHHQFWESST